MISVPKQEVTPPLPIDIGDSPKCWICGKYQTSISQRQNDRFLVVIHDHYNIQFRRYNKVEQKTPVM